MTPNQFSNLLDYLEKEHSEICNLYCSKYALVRDELVMSQPAKVSDESFKELTDIIKEWKDKNNAH